MWLKMKRTSLKFGRGNLWQNVCTVEGNWIISTDNKCKDRHWFFAQNQGRTLHSVVYSRLTESIPKIQTKQQKTGPLINVLLDVSLLYFINCLPEFTAWSFPGCFAVPPPRRTPPLSISHGMTVNVSIYRSHVRWITPFVFTSLKCTYLVSFSLT